MSENLSSDTLAGGAVNTPADGGETVGSPALTLAELNKQLGADFKDTATALKALKDTQSFVGKRKEDIAAEVRSQSAASSQQTDSLKSEVQSLKNDVFYSANPQYKEYQALISRMGGNPSEVVETPEFKTMFEKVAKVDELANTRSVVSSNARVATDSNVTQKAVNVANSRGTTAEDVALVLARGINAEASQ